MTETILATGGAGYIGSHVVVELMTAGHRVVVLDDLSNARAEAVDRVNALSNREAVLIEGDGRDAALLDRVFTEYKPTGVIHLAGLKAVGESVAKPALYYDVNIGTTVELLKAMIHHKVARLVFSSSATVYGDPDQVPIREDAAIKPTNPYGRTKALIEQIMTDTIAAEPWMQMISLRYFNPVGAHPTGTIGEDPKGIPNNLFPFIAQVAIGRREKLSIFGDDWPTSDGTGVRDYIHVVDLARGHVAALAHLFNGGAQGANVAINLGTGVGISVREAVAAFQAASGREVPCEIAARRDGDIAVCYADPGLAGRLLDWRAELDFAAMCRDHWAWQSANPEGYG